MEGPADRQSAHVIQPSRIPEQSAHAIEVPLLAWVIPKEDQTCTDLAASRQGRRSISSCLAILRCRARSTVVPELLDDACFPEVYRSYSGGDDLMWSLCRLSHATARQSGR